MARNGRVSVRITSDTSSLKKGVQQSEQDLGRLQSVSRKAGGGLGLAFKSAAGVIAAAGVADQIKETIQAAENAQVAQQKMATQLRASGVSYRAHAKAIDEVIHKTSALSGLENHDLQDAFTNIVRSTGKVSQSLKLVGLAADIARAKHIDVAKAGQLVAKVAAGSTSALGRYGIVIQKGATATQALGILQRKFSGQAEAYGKTAAGAQDRFRVAVEELRVKLGTALLPIVTKVTTKVSDFVGQMVDGKGAGGRFADALKSIADKIAPIVKFFTDHPKIIAVAVAAWAAYRLAASAAIAATRIKALGMFLGLGKKAAVGGAEAGGAFGAAAAGTAGTTFQGKAPGRFSRIAGAFKGPGAVIGGVLATAITVEAIKQFHDRRGGLVGAISDIANTIMPVSPHGANLNIKGGKVAPGTTVDIGTGQVTTVGHRGNAIGNITKGVQNVAHRPGHSSGPGQNAPGGARARGASLALGGPVAQAASVGGQKFSFEQLRALWVRAGGSAKDATLMAHVAMAESGGYAGARNPSGASGLWQILGLPFPGDPFDPLTNARMAVWKLAHQGLGAWAASRGSWGQYVGQSAGPINTSVLGSSVGGATAPTPKKPAKPLATLGKKVVAAVATPGKLGVPKTAPIYHGTDKKPPVSNPTGTPEEIDAANVQRDLDIIDALEGAGRLSHADADSMRKKALTMALGGGYGPIGLMDSLGFQKSLNDLNAPATDTTSGDAANQQLADVNAKLQQLVDLKEQERSDVQRALNVSQSQYLVFAKGLADIVSGQLGGRIGLGFQTPSYAGGVAKP